MSEARAFTPRVTVVPATLNRFTAMPISQANQRRVAAYARVSTDMEEQQNSYAAQVSYYTDYIQSNSAWKLIDVYTDDGVSATNTKKRDGFNQMVRDALDGKIDLIITKSVSRFARNTVDSLTTVRMLKEKGVEVYFEKENIYTLDSKGELLITIMSSLAQEESRSISENVTWGMRKRFADGKVALPYKQFLGYRKGEDGLPVIVPEEAEIVKDIYRMFMEGKSPSYIARHLTERGIPSPAGKPSWRPNTVASILTNEKYKGDALLQKKFTVDFLTKTMKINEGEVQQFYVENSHPAIVVPELFDAVQVEMKRRKESGRRNVAPHCFSGRIFCDECGSLYGSKVWHSHTVWQCNARQKGLSKCTTPSLRNETMKEAFVCAFNQIIGRKDEIVQICEETLSERCDPTGLSEQLASLQLDLDGVIGLMQRLIGENAHAPLDQVAYQRQYGEYAARYDAIRARIDEVGAQREALIAKFGRIQSYLAMLREQGPVRTFNETLLCGTVEQVRIKKNGTMRFVFKDGAVVEV